MALKLGLDARLYYNSGNNPTTGAPTWVHIPTVREVTLTLEADEVDVTTRGSAGWKETMPALYDASIEWEMIWDPAIEGFAAVRTAFLNRTTIELAVLDGDVTQTGTQGLRAICVITKFSRNEPLNEAITASVTAKPAYSPMNPTWMTV